MTHILGNSVLIFMYTKCGFMWSKSSIVRNEGTILTKMYVKIVQTAEIKAKSWDLCILLVKDTLQIFLTNLRVLSPKTLKEFVQ